MSNTRVPPMLMNEVTATLLSRSALYRQFFDKRRDYNEICGWPPEVTIDQYKAMYDREGVGSRVVEIWPEISWSDDPELKENEDTEKTEWENAWDELSELHNIFSFFSRVDSLSRIGRFGIMLLGIGDGKKLDQPVSSVSEKPYERNNEQQYELLFIRTLDESLVRVDQFETRTNSVRYGKPLMYNVQLMDDETMRSAASLPSSTDVKVHWSRVIHVADNLGSNECFGSPAMKRIFNRLIDLIKILGGGAEMFYKGGFPGFAFTIDPRFMEDGAEIDFDEEDLKKKVDAYFQDLQRSIMTKGMDVKSLATQVADPESHVMSELKYIAASINTPLRVFLGSEQSQLASSQDLKKFNRAVRKRRVRHCTPAIIDPFVYRMMQIGQLPWIISEDNKKPFKSKWPDPDAPAAKDKADISKIITEALSAYVRGNVTQIMGPKTYLMKIVGLDREEVDIIEKEVQEIMESEMKKREDEMNQREAEMGARESQMGRLEARGRGTPAASQGQNFAGSNGSGGA